jgi:hypothetical protein
MPALLKNKEAVDPAGPAPIIQTGVDNMFLF